MMIYCFTFQYGSTLIHHKMDSCKNVSNFTFQYGSTLIHDCQFRIFPVLIHTFWSISLYRFYFLIHFIMFFIKKPLIPLFTYHCQPLNIFISLDIDRNFPLLIYIISKFGSVISPFIILAFHNFNFFS